MILQDYLDSEKECLDKFKEFWEERQKETPENFPEEMDYAEWHEQLVSFGQAEGH